MLTRIRKAEETLIDCFSIRVIGYFSREIVQNLLEKLWLKNRWTGRFYFAIQPKGIATFVVAMTKFKEKDDLDKASFVKELKSLLPVAKRRGDKRVTVTVV